MSVVPPSDTEPEAPATSASAAPAELLWGRLTGTAGRAVAWLQAVPLKALSAVVIVLFFTAYAIEGAGRTVIAAFHLPPGVDGQTGDTLTHDLITEMARIRTVQDTAQRLQFNLVRGLESQQAGSDRLDLDMSVSVNAEYKRVNEHFGTMKVSWGPIEVPVELLLRPLQRFVLRQRVLEVAVGHDGDAWHAVSSADDGRMWEAASTDVAALDGADPCSGVRCLLPALAYKMAFLSGDRYEPADSWIGYYHFHRGVRDLLDYDQRGGTDAASAVQALDRALADFQRAVALNPQHRKARYDLLLASMERASYLPLEERAGGYQTLIAAIKDFLPGAAAAYEDTLRLLTAAYVLLAETQRNARDFAAAVPLYHAALALLPADAPLRTYALNNLALTYRELSDTEQARHWLQVAAAENPDYPRARVNLGDLAMSEGDYAAAESTFVSVVQRHPDHAQALYNLGVLYLSASLDDTFWTRLGEGARECLRQQALVALADILAQSERAAVIRTLSRSELASVANAKELAEQLPGARGATPTPPASWTYRLCLGA